MLLQLVHQIFIFILSPINHVHIISHQVLTGIIIVVIVVVDVVVDVIFVDVVVHYVVVVVVVAEEIELN